MKTQDFKTQEKNMNDETPFTAQGDEPVEARIVSWVLGEASAFEVAELERLCDEQPELMVFKRRMAALHGLITEAEKPRFNHAWKLPAGKRRPLDEIFGELSQPSNPVIEKRVRHSARRALLAIAACVVITLVILQLIPREQSSRAVLEIRPRATPMQPLGQDMSGDAGKSAMTPQFFGTEFENIKSRKSLEKVAEKLDLAGRWGTDKEQAVEQLKKSVQTKNIRGTDLIEIEVNHRDKSTADEIAREVAYAYKDYRQEIEEKDAERQLGELNKAVRAQEDKVEERRKVLATIARTHGTIAANDSKEAIKRSVDGQDYAAAKREFETEQELLQTMKLKQIGESISQKIPIQSVQIHELPGQKNSESSSALASNDAMESLRTDLPRELIEGTPKPIVLPGQTPSKEKAQQDAPAMMMAKRAQPESALKPSAPQSSMSKVTSATTSSGSIPTPDVDLATPSLDFGEGKDFGTGWGGADDGRLAERAARPRIVPEPAAADAPSPSATPPAPAESSLALRDSDDLKGGKGSGSGGGFSNASAEDERNNAASIVAGSVSGLADAKEGGLKNDLADRGENNKTGTGYWSADESAKAETRGKNLPANRGMILDELEVTEEASGGRGPAPSAAPEPMPNKPVGSKSYSELAQREMVRRQKNADEGDRDIVNYEDPLRTNPALTFEHQQKVDEVRKDLYKAEGNYNLGKYDDAKREYEDVLRKDPYNTAARRGMERIASAKSDYYRAAYDHTRAELLAQVDNAWELNAPAESGAKDKFDGTVNYGLPIQESSNFDTAGFDVSKSSDHIVGFTGESNEADADKVPLLGEIPLVGAIFKAESKPGEIEYEIHTGYTSEHLFRGGDLGEVDKEVEVPADKVEMDKSVKFKKKKAMPEPPKVDLTQLMEEIAASEDPYSTFSLNISDASFQIAQAALAKGERPDPAGIKVEQFYNAVNYGDPAPAAGQPVSCVIEQAAHPVIPGRNLVRVALKTAAAGRSAAQPLRLTLLVDQSGSMSRADRREAMDTAMRSLGTLLTDKDLVTVIGFSRTSRLLAVDMKGNEVGEKLAGLVNQAASEGGTNLEEAIKLAEQKAMRQKLVGAQNRIVLFTDGAANLGDADPQRLAAKVEQLRQQGIAFDIAGIAADDLNDELLAELARKGNGRYSVVGKGENQNFAKQLAGSFRPAAENVKVQVRFNPERVARYKLIGFEKDRLKTEDFRNDAVDAAELAAEEAGVAIYQVEPLAEGRGEIGEVSVRFRDTASGEMVERMWTMAHDPATPGVGRATPSMQLAVLAMLAGEKLKGGPLADAIDFKQFAEPQAVVKQAFGQDTRVAEMLRMVDALK